MILPFVSRPSEAPDPAPATSPPAPALDPARRAAELLDRLRAIGYGFRLEGDAVRFDCPALDPRATAAGAAEDLEELKSLKSCVVALLAATAPPRDPRDAGGDPLPLPPSPTLTDALGGLPAPGHFPSRRRKTTELMTDLVDPAVVDAPQRLVERLVEEWDDARSAQYYLAQAHLVRNGLRSCDDLIAAYEAAGRYDDVVTARKTFVMVFKLAGRRPVEEKHRPSGRPDEKPRRPAERSRQPGQAYTSGKPVSR